MIRPRTRRVARSAAQGSRYDDAVWPPGPAKKPDTLAASNERRRRYRVGSNRHLAAVAQQTTSRRACNLLNGAALARCFARYGAFAPPSIE